MLLWTCCYAYLHRSMTVGNVCFGGSDLWFHGHWSHKFMLAWTLMLSYWVSFGTIWPYIACALSTGVSIFNLGEGATQDRLWPTLPAADVEGAQAGIWAVREGACGGGTTRETQQAEREEGPVQTAAWRSTSHEQVRSVFIHTIVTPLQFSFHSNWNLFFKCFDTVDWSTDVSYPR